MSGTINAATSSLNVNVDFGQVGAGTHTATINDNVGGAVFTLNGGTLTIDGAGGDDTLTILTDDGLTASVTGGGGGSDTITGPDAANTWNVNAGTLSPAGSGTVTITSGFETFQGGSSTDAFSVTAAAGTFALKGGGGVDTFTIDDTLTGSIDGEGGADILDVGVSGEGFTVTAAGTSGVDGTVSASISGGFSDIDDLRATAGTNTLTGDDAASTWTLDGTPGYTVGGQTADFSGFETLQGGTDADAFNVSSATGAPTTYKGGGGDDTLTLDYTANLQLGGGAISYEGEGQTSNDTLVIQNGSVVDQIFNFTNLNDGSVALTVLGGGPDETITYTGLEPITSTITAANVTLNYSTAAETITITDAGGGSVSVASTAGENVTFSGPSTFMTVNAGDTGNDTINLNSLPAAFVADLTIDGEGGATDSVTLADNLPTTIAGLTLDAETVDFSGTTTVAGTVDITTDTLTITTGVAAGANDISIKESTGAEGIELAGTSVVNALQLADGTVIDRLTTGGSVIFGNLGDGPITISGAVDAANTSTLELLTGGDIVDGGGSITETNLSMNAGGQIGTTTAGEEIETAVSNLEANADAGGVFINNTGNLTIGGIGAIDGIQATGDIEVTAASDLTVSEGIGNGSPTGIALDASGKISVDADVNTAGAVTISAPTVDVDAEITGASIDGDTDILTVNLEGSGVFAEALALAQDGTTTTFDVSASGNAESFDVTTVGNIRTFTGDGDEDLTSAGSLTLSSKSANAGTLATNKVAFGGVDSVTGAGTGDSNGTTFDNFAAGPDFDANSISFSGYATIAGGASANDQITANSNVTLSGAEAGTLASPAVSFTEIEILSGSNNTITGSAGADNITLAGTYMTVSLGGGADVLTVDGGTVTTINGEAGNDQITIQGGASVTGVNGGDDDDTLTLDFSGGDVGGVAYDGGAGGSNSDSLALTGGSPTTVTHSFTDNNSGSVSFVGGFTAITYSDLEPIIDDMDAANRVFTFTDNTGAEAITLKSGGTFDNVIDSDIGAESVDFKNPTVSLTVNATGGSEVDTISWNSLDAGFDATVTFNGANGNDILTIAAGLPAGIDSITTDANIAVTVNGDVTTDDTQTYNGTVALGGNINFTSTNVDTINFANTLTGTADALTVTGNADFDAAVTGLTTLNVTGTTNIGTTTITSTGAQDYDGAVTLSVDDIVLTTTDSLVNFDSKINSDGTPRDLSVQTSAGTAVFDLAIGGTSILDDIDIDATGAGVALPDINADLLDIKVGGDITQQGGSSLTVGDTTLNAGGNAATLSKTGNTFGTITASSVSTVDIEEDAAMDLGAIAALPVPLNWTPAASWTSAALSPRAATLRSQRGLM